MNLQGKQLVDLVNKSDLMKSYCGIDKDFKNICYIGHNTVHQDLGNGKKRGVFYGKRKFKGILTTNMLMNFAHEGVFKHLEKKYGDRVLEEYMHQPMWKPALVKYGSASFNPDADPESTSVDGYTLQSYSYGAGDTWGNLISDAGSNSSDSVSSQRVIYIQSDHTVADTWRGLWRGIQHGFFLFDTASLGAGATVSAADLKIYGTAKSDILSITPDINVYSSAPASNTALVAGDFDSLGTTAFCDTAITYANYSTTGYNTFALNANGIATIDVEGISKFGLRNANYDVSGTPPSWSSDKTSNLNVYYADNGSNEPTLDVVWSEVSSGGGTNLLLMGIG